MAVCCTAWLSAVATFRTVAGGLDIIGPAESVSLGARRWPLNAGHSLTHRAAALPSTEKKMIVKKLGWWGEHGFRAGLNAWSVHYVSHGAYVCDSQRRCFK